MTKSVVTGGLVKDCVCGNKRNGLVSKCGLCLSIGCLPELGAGTLPHFSLS